MKMNKGPGRLPWRWKEKYFEPSASLIDKNADTFWSTQLTTTSLEVQIAPSVRHIPVRPGHTILSTKESSSTFRAPTDSSVRCPGSLTSFRSPLLSFFFCFFFFFFFGFFFQVISSATGVFLGDLNIVYRIKVSD